MYQNILNHEFESLMSDPNSVVVDVRTPDEIKSGFIPGTSIFIDFNGDLFDQKIQALDRSKKYLVYCRSGARSAKTCRILEEMGFNGPFYNLAKGIADWSGDLRIP